MPRPRPMRPLIAIIGATGTGKSKLAVDLATRYNGEIINGDALQLYDALPIITNKIPAEERNGIPHHLLGCIGLGEEPWRVDTFVPRALSVIQEIHSRGKLPILVGGTHYYTQSLLFKDVLLGHSDNDAIPVAPHSDDLTTWPILNAPLPEVLAQLKEVDPIMAGRWHPNDDRKIRRSLEIYLKTGWRASDMYEEQKKRKQEAINYSAPNETFTDGTVQTGSLRFSPLILWAHTPRPHLVERLDQRVDEMIDQGLLGELSDLDSFLVFQRQQGHEVDQSKGIWVAIGYKEFQDYMAAVKDIDSSGLKLEELRTTAIEKTKKATRDYAKAQVRWIRIKLINSLADSEARNSLFLIDTSSPEAWETSVLQPALDYTSKYLDGSTLPDPTKESGLARDLLTAKRQYDLSQRSDLWKQRTCDLCNTTLVTEEDWERHLKSRGHRSLVKKALRKKEREESQQGEPRIAQSEKDIDDANLSEDEKFAMFQRMESMSMNG